MHEFSITKNILSLALDKAKEEEAKKIVNINLIIGQLTGVIDESVKLYFGFISKDTIADGASLHFYHPPTTLRCRDCTNVYSPENREWACPECGEQKIEILSGRQLTVTSIEVE